MTDPFLVDQLSISPAQDGVRKVYGDDGELYFTDLHFPNGIGLRQIVGLQNSQSMRVVAKTGSLYTTIQAAVDSIPVGGDSYVILVLPGVYTETVSVYRDNLTFIAWGSVVIQSLDDHTLSIQSLNGTIPKKVGFSGFHFKNGVQSKACVRLAGGAGSQVGLNGVVFKDCKFEATSALGNFTLIADTINYLDLIDCDASLSHDSSICTITNCAKVKMRDTKLTSLSVVYDQGEAEPNVIDGSLVLERCDEIGVGSSLDVPFSLSMTDRGSCLIESCHGLSSLALTGNQTLTARNSSFSTITGGTFILNLRNSTYAAIVGAGTTLNIDEMQGVSSFVAQALADVEFPITLGSDDYKVFLTVEGPVDSTPWVNNKSEDGFRINFAGNETVTINWSITV